jgi:hypothetical protein
MAEDFRIKTSWRTHRKRKALKRNLGADGVLAIEDLWSYATSERTNGVLDGMSAQDIADEVDYTSDAAMLVATLVDLRLLDSDSGIYSLHDWADHQPWVAHTDERSAHARANAHIKHHKDGKHSAIVAACPLCYQHADSMRTAPHSMRAACAPCAPSPSPSPSISDLDHDLREEKKAVGGAPLVAATAEPAIVSIPLNTGAEFPVTQPDVDAWSKDYPAVNVSQALVQMRNWCLAKPERRKTKRGVKAFVVGWLGREQNRGGVARSPPYASRETIDQERARKHDEWCRAELAKQEALNA